jgi:hypothetical protein
MSPERRLWQAVITQAVRDAESVTSTRLKAPGDTLFDGSRAARQWLVKAGTDFRLVCALAGWEPDFISEAFRDGRLTGAKLVSEDAQKRRERRAAHG